MHSLTRVAAVASTETQALFNPELLASVQIEAQGALNLDRVERALFRGQTPKPVERRVEVCTAPDVFGRQFSASAQSDQVRVFDVRRALLASGMALWVALYSRDALMVSLTEGTANWEVALLNDNYQLLSQTRFQTERSGERTLDGVGALLSLDHGLISARIGFGCAAKDGERFVVPIELAGRPSCAHALEEPFPPNAYPQVTPKLACAPAPVSISTTAPTTKAYEATQRQRTSASVMPYVEEDVASLDADWQRIAQLLAPRAAEQRPTVAQEAAAAAVALGSARHTTQAWSQVSGYWLRLHQLLPLVDARGQEAYLALYSRQNPVELLHQAATWYVTLLSPSYTPEAEVHLETQPPASPAARALQTDLWLEAGLPVVRIRYLSEASIPTTGNAAVPPARELRFPLSLNMADRCIARRQND